LFLFIGVAGIDDHTEAADNNKDKENDAGDNKDVFNDDGKNAIETLRVSVGAISATNCNRIVSGINTKIKILWYIYSHIKIRIAKNGRICDMNKRGLVEKLTSRSYRKRLVGFVEQKVGRQEDVEEIVQESLIAAWDSLPTYKGKSDLFTWLCAITRHEIADFYRRRKLKQIVFSRLPFLKDLVCEALGPELAYQELETKRKILKTLKDLSEGYGRILRLKYIESLSMKEIAQKLGITVKAVESRLSRARLAFQAAYVKEPAEVKTLVEESG